MSSFAVTVEQLTILPHPNADALELAQVGLYRAVVPKGVYQTGDYALYIPEQAVLPDELIEELGLVGRLAGKNKDRVKAIRLRGEVSQGIVCRPGGMKKWNSKQWASNAGSDWAEDFGIKKWVPQIPPHMNGQVEAAPDLMRWIDIENLQRYPDIFEPGEPVVATEKIHGTACLVTFDADKMQTYVSSKGYGSRNQALKQDPNNLYWRAVEAYELDYALEELCEDGGYERAAVFGEVFGKGVQDLHYGASSNSSEKPLGFRAFDIKVDTGSGEHWLNPQEFREACFDYSIPVVPMLYQGPFDIEILRTLASGKTTLDADHIREGVVIRPQFEQYSEVTGGRKIAKLISPDYLLRKGEVTEFE